MDKNHLIEHFDNYEFSVKTQVLYKGNWYNIDNIDFENRLIGIKNCQELNLIHCLDIEDIK